MDLRTLQLFSDLCETLHFGTTSQNCNISASALTRAIQRLEDEVGEPLFIRDNRRVAMTRTGHQFRTTAGKMISEWQSFQRELESDEGVLHGELSIYSSVTAVYTILPEILRNFRQKHPEVYIKLETGDAADALEKVRDGAIDVVVAALPDKLPESLSFIKLVETDLVCIATKEEQGSPVILNDEGAVDWRRTPVIYADRGLSRSRLESYFRSNNIQPNIYARVAGHEAIIAMVRLGGGVGVVPELVLEKSPFRDDVTVINGPQLTPYTVGICMAKGNLNVPVIKALRTIV